MPSLKRKDAAAVRELDDWEFFKEKRFKRNAGENTDQVAEILALISDDKASNEELIRLFKEFQLRQKITLKNQPQDVFRFEKEKNDLVLKAIEEESARLKQELSAKYEMLNMNKMLLTRFNAQVESLQAESDSSRELQILNRQKMANRKRELQGSKDLNKLRRMAVLKSATKDLTDVENSVNDHQTKIMGSPRNISRESLEVISEPDSDIYENDQLYLRLKTEVVEAEKTIRSRVS